MKIIQTLRRYGAPVLLSLLSASYIANAQVINPAAPATGVPLAGTGISVVGQTVSVNYGVANSPFTGTLSAAGITSNKSITASANIGAFNFGTLGYSDVDLFGSFAVTDNNHANLALQNLSNGVSAKTMFSVANDSGTSTTFRSEFGINSSTSAGTNFLNLPSGSFIRSFSGDLSIGTATANAIHFGVNTGASDAMTISSAGTITNTGATVLNGALSGTGLTNYFASPPAIGGTTPAAGTFTTATATNVSAGLSSIGVIGAAFNGSTDDSAVINTALTNFNTVDCQGKTAKISSSVTVPANKTLQNCNLILGTAGMNGVLVNTGAKLLYDKITGTGTTNIVERGVYPATDAVTDVQLNVEVTNMTIGVQAQNIGTYTQANYPRRWTGFVYAHDIVGAVGVSEGYGVLLSPAWDCNIKVEAKNIARHAVYLSAGAKANFVDLNADTVSNYVVQLASTSPQDPTQYNTLRIKARNVTPNVVGQSAAIAMAGIVNYNTVNIDIEGNGSTTYAATVQGGSGGPYPLGNKIVDGSITGQFAGTDVINTLNADSTIVARNKINAYATFSIIAARTTGTNGALHGINVYDNSIDGQAQNVIGIYDEDTAQPSFIGPNDIANNGTSNRVTDNTSGKRSGYSRRALFSATTASIPAVNSADTVVTLSQALQTTGRSGAVNINGGSGTFFNTAFWGAIISAPAVTTATIRTYNGAASAQTLNINGWIDGD